ncbi:hypothetical protein Patl1_11639 [Pistacia atlantica]|uniref:Uncharacterized protein n=1 Tax=Pistacia atlantica TaxID=434234 RepID=A0ACC1A7R8_9ROSI|nr:hypothetical protein Patl1_11639 [Pistacia atlantica]
MNSLRRAVAQIAYSQSTTKRTLLRPTITALLAQSYSTKQWRNAKPAAADVWPRPSEIPFQVKVANSVSLIGHVDSPVQFETSPDGKHWAGTVINQRATSDSPQLWIPVVFEGDLAHIAACHLKKDDHVHIAGQLTADPPSPIASQRANVQVMVHSVHFVDVSYKKGKPFSSQKQEVGTTDHSASTKNDGNSASSPWDNLLNNPELWWDYRSQKRSGLVMTLVKSGHPDFKRKDGGLSLWLTKSSGWVLSHLDGIEFDVRTPKQKIAKEGKNFQTPKSNYPKRRKGDEPWKDLTENPKKWWDNRLDKLSKNAPDFKHKETGEGLWLNSAPDWVLPKLPEPVKSQKAAAFGKRDTLLS